MMDREFLGKLVRIIWVKWAKKQPNPKPSWLVEWDDLDKNSKEIDCLIGEKIAEAATIELQAELDKYKHAMGEAIYLLNQRGYIYMDEGWKAKEILEQALKGGG